MKNKNLKQNKLNNKKRNKLFLILTAGALAAASAVIPAVTLAATSKGQSQLQITFNSQYGFVKGAKTSFQIKKGTTLGEILPPTIDLTSSAGAGSFCGWARTSDFVNNKVHASKIIKASTKFDSSQNLTAVFKNNVSNVDELTWCEIKFEQDSDGKATITGNTFLEVPVGYGIRFQDINHPSVSVPSGNKFDYWTKEDGTKFQELTEITESVKLYAHVAAANLLTFHPGEGTVSSETVAVELGSTFGSISVPQATYTGEGEKFLAGWYSKDSSSTNAWDENYLYTNDTVIGSPTADAYARWEAADATTYSKITAVVPTGETFTYDSNTTFLVRNGSVWKNFNHPNPQSTSKKVAYWEYSIDGSSWTTIDPDTSTFGAGTDHTYTIRPVMESKITDMKLLLTDQQGVANPTFEQNVEIPVKSLTYPLYNATEQQAKLDTVTPTTKGVSQKVKEWKVYKWDTTLATPDWVATSDTEASVTVSSNTDKLATATVKILDPSIQRIKIEATSNLDNNWKASQELLKLNPFTLDLKYFTNVNGATYELVDIDNQFASSIKLLKLDGKTEFASILKSDFNYPVFIGEKVTEIPANFLAGCAKFDNIISKLPTTTKPITKIGSNFLYGAKVFTDQGEYLPALLANVRIIGNNFMAGNELYNKSNIVLPVIEKIGDGFFQNNKTFSKQVLFKSGAVESALTEIGNNFLSGCTVFNSDIEFPATLTVLGDHCMYACDAFQSTITMEANPEASGIDKNVEMFSSTSQDSKLYNPGFKFDGTYAELAHEIWADLDGTKSGLYRKSEAEEGEITNVQAEPAKTSFGLGSPYSSSRLTLLVTYGQSNKQKRISWYGQGACPWTTNPAQGTILSDAGQQQIAVTYKEKTVTYDVTVRDAAVPKLSTSGLLMLSASCGMFSVKALDTFEYPQSLELSDSYCDDTEGGNNEEKDVGEIADEGFKNHSEINEVKAKSTDFNAFGSNALEGTSATSVCVEDNTDWEAKDSTGETKDTFHYEDDTTSSVGFAAKLTNEETSKYRWVKKESTPQGQLVYTYHEDLDAYSVKAAEGAEFERGEVLIEDSYNGKPVVAIEDYGFTGITSISKVTIGSNIGEIGLNVFSGCTNLTSVEFKTKSTWKIGYDTNDVVYYDAGINASLDAEELKASTNELWIRTGLINPDDTKDYDLQEVTGTKVSYQNTTIGTIAKNNGILTKVAGNTAISAKIRNIQIKVGQIVTADTFKISLFDNTNKVYLTEGENNDYTVTYQEGSSETIITITPVDEGGAISGTIDLTQIFLVVSQMATDVSFTSIALYPDGE